MDQLDSNPVEWHPGRLFGQSDGQSKPPLPEDVFNLIVLNVPLSQGDHAPLKQLWPRASVKVAADGGANRLYHEHHKQAPVDTEPQNGEDDVYRDLDVIIGDLDSLESSARNYYLDQGTEIIQDGDQYSTDLGKAIMYLRKKYGQRTIVTHGGLGGRVDQGLSQLHHLYLFQQEPGYSQGQLYLVSEESITFLLKAGSHRIRVRGHDEGDRDCDVFGKHVGIIPIREPSQITTKGLEWDVTEWHTEIGGLVSTSNHVLPETEVIEVQTTKDVLFTISLRLPRRS